MKNKMLLIVGRTCTGKDTLVNKLTKYGYTVVKSYTTRPRRVEGENTHIFVTEQEAAAIPDRDKVATTIINGYQYFATRKQVQESDIYIIDPKGLYELTANCPEVQFEVISVTADTDKSQVEAIERGGLKEKAIFRKRSESENEQFTDFENVIRYNDQISENCHVFYRYHNDFVWSRLEKTVEYIVKNFKQE